MLRTGIASPLLSGRDHPNLQAQHCLEIGKHHSQVWKYLPRLSDWEGGGGFLGVALLLTMVTVTAGHSLAQTTVNLFGAGTPGVVDIGSPQPVVLGVKIFSDVAGRVLGCSFYKAPTNTGAHVVSLWDSAGKLLASQVAPAETSSGKQSVLFSSPVSIAAKQTFMCGYFAPAGHFSYDKSAFTVQKNVSPLHVPVNGGVYVYGTQPTRPPTSFWQGGNYWVDVLFSPSTGSTTWINSATGSTTGSTASVTWNTAVPSDSQVEYGSTTSYGNVTTLAAAPVTAHSVALSGLSAGTQYHFRVRSRDSDSVLALGPDHTLTAVAAVLPVTISTSPLNATISSGATQQFMALVSNTPNAAVTWSATAGTINSSGLFTAPSVSAQTSVSVTATSQADTGKRSSASLTVNPASSALAVSPTTLSFSGQVGASNLAPASVSIKNTGAGSLTFTGTSDQPWLVLSAASGTAPYTLQVSPAISGMKAGTYTGHATLTGGGVTKAVTVALTLTATAQHSVALSWKGTTGSTALKYNMYRSTISGGYYAVVASALTAASYSDQNVQPATTYYYVVTAVDGQGRESGHSNEIKAVIP